MACRGNDITENEPPSRPIREYVRPNDPTVSTPACFKPEPSLGHYDEENYLYENRNPFNKDLLWSGLRNKGIQAHPDTTFYGKSMAFPGNDSYCTENELLGQPFGEYNPFNKDLLWSGLRNKDKKLIGSSLSDKEIQGHPYLKNELSHYETFHDYKVVKAVNGEKVQQALRVVLPDSTVDIYNKTTSLDLGTIVHVDEDGKVTVEWDRPCKTRQVTFEKEDNNQYPLLLYDNTQAGVIHGGVKCETCELFPIRGIRWACYICDVNLCTKCYMGDKHRIDHVFIRIISPHSKGVEMPLRSKGTKKIFSPVKASGNRDTVKDDERSMTSEAVELTCWQSFYHGHLPVLGQCSDGYFNVWIDDCELQCTDQVIDSQV